LPVCCGLAVTRKRILMSSPATCRVCLTALYGMCSLCEATIMRVGCTNATTRAARQLSCRISERILSLLTWSTAHGRRGRSNASLYTTPVPVTWASDNRVWHDKPSGLYYVGDGAPLSYPLSYAAILHIKSGNIVLQIMFSSGLAVRRFNTTQPMDWNVK